ncbi:MAG: cytochrome c oxidase accessory protein CcoG [Chromatiaceae bacterium]|nr:cytochrome c oxidase accessory protein CcoG [Chromatiaceae bacterium]
MSTSEVEKTSLAVDQLYEEADYWHVNTGGETIHAKRLPGKWRLIKWLAASVWLVFFLGPYLRWDGRQAVLWDIPARQFHIFSATVLPQDFWMLSLVLLFFAILLAVVTALVGRVWCGFFCFQTVWTDVYTWIEEKFEGQPAARRKLAKAPLDARKAAIKVAKHLLWLLIGFLTGFSFVAWFTDAPTLWMTFFNGEANVTIYFTVALFTVGTYGLAGYLREQACFWLCPYARIQAVMVDKTTELPTYDFHRGEPRGRIKRGQKEEGRTTGDCVDCKQCVAVCPTGVDIRQGQQEGCITCALCIDACDQVMEKVDRAKGLIRYASLDELNGVKTKPLLKRGRVWVYSTILLLAVAGIVYGLSSLDAIELKVLHERAPLFVTLSDGSIQNKYTLKVLNKTTEDLQIRVSVSGPEGLALIGAEKDITARNGFVSPEIVFVRIPRTELTTEQMPIRFHVEGTRSTGEILRTERESVFIGPRR